MEPKWSNPICKLRLLMLCFVLVTVTKPTSAIEIHTDPEVIVQNGTTGTLRCTFKSSEVVSNSTSVIWTYHRFQSDNWFTLPYLVLLFSNENEIIPDDYKDRVKFIGDMNKNDVSIQLSPIQFSDNGTFFCDVKNPPDVTGTPGRTMLKVVPKVAVNTTDKLIYTNLTDTDQLPAKELDSRVDSAFRVLG